MVRRLLTIAAFVACSGIHGLAVGERATFILTDGERKSGAVVFHTESRENLINGNLNLSNDATGQEQTYRFDQVAVIDFVGGRPSAAELQTLPADSSIHVLVTRDGGSQFGTFVNMIGGDTVRWKNQAGEQQQFAIRDVRRIYLNAQSARTVFNYHPATNATPAIVGTAGQVEPGSVQVLANQPWTDTGVTVKKGDRITFRTTGQIAFGQSTGQVAGADGSATVTSAAYPVPVMPVGGLIGKVANSAPFPIGSNTQPIVMPADGRLMLGVNDDRLVDNSGAFSVVIAKAGR